MKNTKLMNAFCKGYAISQAIPGGKKDLKAIVEQYATGSKINYTEEELNQVINEGMIAMEKAAGDYENIDRILN